MVFFEVYRLLLFYPSVHDSLEWDHNPANLQFFLAAERNSCANATVPETAVVNWAGKHAVVVVVVLYVKSLTQLEGL